MDESIDGLSGLTCLEHVGASSLEHPGDVLVVERGGAGESIRDPRPSRSGEAAPLCPGQGGEQTVDGIAALREACSRSALNAASGPSGSPSVLSRWASISVRETTRA